MKKLVTAALCGAGGAWNGDGRQYQLKLTRQHDPDGWFNYCRKDWPRTRRAITGPVTFIPNSLRGAAKAFYEQTRQQMIEQKQGEVQSALTYHHKDTFDTTTTFCESSNRRGNTAGLGEKRMSVYMNLDDYHRLVTRLAVLNDPAPGLSRADEVKLILGELGDVWPESIAPADDLTPPTHDLPSLEQMMPMPSFPTLGPVDQNDLEKRTTTDARGRKVLDLDS